MLRQLSIFWSNFICKTSWDILRQNGKHLKWYLPKCVLNVVRRELSCMRCMLKKSFFAFHLEHIGESDNLCVISSNVGALWCSEMMALFISLGSH